MSIFAGVFARRDNLKIPFKIIDELRATVSRNPEHLDSRIEFSNSGIYIVKVDVGAFGEPGEFSSSKATAFVAGDPILQFNIGSSTISRAESLRAIASNLAVEKVDALRLCRGTYCAVVYENTNNKLHLMTDKLGIRPVYCWILPEYFIFATALRILEAMTFFQKKMDLQGVAEIASFGYPLSDRTPYENIHCLHAGELVTVDIKQFHRKKYWFWNNIPGPLTFANSDKTPHKRLYRIFNEAVSIRLRKQKTVGALLSGGLDSRVIAATLKSKGVKVLAANLGAPTSQDKVFGQLIAERLGIHYWQLKFRPLVEGDPYGKAAVSDWLNSAEFLAHNPQRPHVVWSGDGGSLGLGHIYLNSDIVAASRAQDLQEATKKFLAYNKWRLQPKLLKKSIAKKMIDMINHGINAELQLLDTADPGRIFYLFLMLNDQRRHMFNHFENMDLACIEFEMPFFDADFIAGIVQEPIDPFLRHAFYLEWLECFPNSLGILEIPWQAYPNHLPCPLPQPQGLSYQWDSKPPSEQSKERRLITLNRARVLLSRSSFSKKYLNYWYMYLFMLLTHWGKADRSYLLHVPFILHHYWTKVSANQCPPQS